EEDNAPASVIVTHHIEEIPKGTTHVALLKNAKLYSSGPIKDTLTSNNLNEVFNVKVRLSFDGERYFASSDVI
ncbi:MAG TPA: ABC transporter ATP-binding protein, partial [Candidatus Nanopelagicaceae bacterium]